MLKNRWTCKENTHIMYPTAVLKRFVRTPDLISVLHPCNRDFQLCVPISINQQWQVAKATPKAHCSLQCITYTSVNSNKMCVWHSLYMCVWSWEVEIGARPFAEPLQRLVSETDYECLTQPITSQTEMTIAHIQHAITWRERGILEKLAACGTQGTECKLM